MKKQNRTHTFALSMMMTGLSVMPVGAFSGQINTGLLETVTCINHDTDQAVPGTMRGTGFDCSALPREPGEATCKRLLRAQQHLKELMYEILES